MKNSFLWGIYTKPQKQWFLFAFLALCQLGVNAQSEPQIQTTAFGADSIAGTNIKMQYYYLHANSVEELKKNIKAERVKNSTAKHFMAKTKSQIKWNWKGQGKANCNLKTLKLSYQIVVEFPRWQMPDSLPEADKKRWQDFIKNLAEHELGHVVITLEEIPLMEERIKNATCSTAEVEAQSAMMELNEAQFRYDDDSHHGWLQGAKF